MSDKDYFVGVSRKMYAGCFAGVVALVAVSMCAGCSGQGQTRDGRAAGGVGGSGGSGGEGGSGGRAIIIDGDLSEWPADAAATSDSDYLYFRVSTGQALSLQAAPDTVSLELDLDGNSETGTQLVDIPDAANFGVDLSVRFSPENDKGQRRGVQVLVYDQWGAARELNHSDIDLTFLPSHAAEWFEVRIARKDIAGLKMDSSQMRGLFVMWGAGDFTIEATGWSDPFELSLGKRNGDGAGDAIVPGPEDEALRVMSFNVLRASPRDDAERFGRLIQVVNPDIVLLQEWTDATAQELETWFTLNVSHEHSWYARVNDAWGVAIVSRFEIVGENPTLTSNDRTVRCVTGLVRTPIGEVRVTSVHLKCCGSYGSSEDLTRIDEAHAINKILGLMNNREPGVFELIGGDMNLVGSHEPLEAMAHGLGEGGSNMLVVPVLVRADTAGYTWSDPASEFAPSRLDYMLLDDESAALVRAFVLDTARLSDAALARAGLDRSDSAGSDHRPVVVDVKVK